MAEKENKPKVVDAVTQQGSTFASRAAAAAGKSMPARKDEELNESTTFASRAGKKADAKQVGDAENKSVSSSESKKKS